MPRPEKVQAVENIREQVDEARATFVTEYRGLTVAEQQKLRRDIRQAQGEYRVLKMSLARRAVEDMEVEGLSELLAGPTALAFASSDPVPVAKALKEFASEHENLVIKGALLAGALLPPEQISRLAEIESRDVLLGKIAGGFKSPMSKLAGMLGAKMRDAASMFSQLLEKKETEAPAAAETEAAAEAEVEEAPAVEAVEETPEAEVEETAEAEVEEAPAVEAVEETPEAEVEETAEAEVEEAPAVEAVEETPEAEVEETAETEAEVAPAEEPEEKQKKKAAPKAKAEESAAPADADATEEAKSDADETAEEE